MIRFIIILIGLMIGVSCYDPCTYAQPSGNNSQKQAKKPPVPLTMQIRPTSIRPRTNAPIHTELDIQWHGRSLLEGYFTFNVYDENRLVYAYRMPEIAIAAQGTLKRNLTLPPVSTTNHALGQITIRPLFQGKPNNYTLDPIPVSVTQNDRRTMAVLMAQPLPGISNAAEFKPYMDALRLETHVPRELIQKLITQYANLKSSDLPRNPLDYLSYDMVVLAGSGFQTAPESAFDPLARWVESGGAILIAPEEKTSAEQIAFLNRLAKSAGESYFFTMGTEKELVINDLKNDPQLLQLSPGLGRAVILLKHRERVDFFELSHWMRAKLFLWDIRKNHHFRIFNSGKFTHQGNQYASMNVPENSAEQVMANRLKPPSVKLMPFSIIVMILVVFVLVIGPVDYFFLGFIRKRKFTWIVFPLMSILFTIVMVKSAEYYTGTEDHLRELHIIDYGTDNNANRHTRYDYRFVGSPKSVTLPTRQAILSIIDRNSIIHSNQMNMRNISFERVQAESGLPITGNYPVNYEITHEVAQWTPQLYRYYLSTPDLPELRPQWENVSYDDFRSFNHEATLYQKLYPNADANVKIDVITPNGMTQWDTRTRSRRTVSHRNRKYDRFRREYLSERDKELAYSLSVRDRQGLFYVFGTVSPSGSVAGEDLVIYDDTDDESLLVVVEEQIGNKFYFHRKVFHRPTNETKEF